MLIRSVDALLAGKEPVAGSVHQLAPNMRFQRQGSIEFMPDIRNLIGGEGLDREAADFIRTERQDEDILATGLFELRDVHLAPPYGAIFDFNNRCCWMGRLLGWNLRDFRIWCKKLPGCAIAQDNLRLDSPMGDDVCELDAAVLISAPHYDGYGHWLLDFLPRIDMAQNNGLNDLPFYRHSGHDWTHEMARSLAPITLMPADGLGAKWVRVRRLFVPGVSRILHGADEAALKSTWLKLGEAMAPAAKTAGRGTAAFRRIAVSRQGWSDSSNKRRLINAPSVERMLQEHGFEIIQPEKLTLAGQRHVFSEAAIVVGEDGSGMHNTIYCQPGTRIGIVAMGRINYVHLLTARMYGHRVTYIPTELVEDHEASGLLDIRRLRSKDLQSALQRLIGV